MSLPAGTHFGAYEVLEPLGAGGMGEVYRARDTVLHRDVAIKVLPRALAANPERVARLAREAQTLATLSHPNIGAIFGFESSGGIQALVLELVDGPTLADLIAQGPLPIDEALGIAHQIAKALDAAHAQGIIHRDLKPANVKVREDGTVKVLDFGLAKADGTPSDPASPTLTSPAALTAAGVVLGTSAYMAPEQAKGMAADKRSDIWAFGCVLYEMLTGRRAFEGEGVTDTLAAVLRAEPDWRTLPGALPPATRTLLERCLRKDRSQRIQDISTARFVLSEQDSFAGAVDARASVAPRRSAATWIAVAAVASLLAGAAAVAVLWPRGDGAAPHVARFVLGASDAEPFAADRSGVNVALSPDGSRIVYTAVRGGVSVLMMRRLDRTTATPIAGTDGGIEPFFSADGTQIGFATSGELKRVAIEGGRSSTIWRGNPTLAGACWGADGTIVFTADATLFRVPAQGGEAIPIAHPDASRGEASYERPVILPGGQVVLYTVIMRSGETSITARRSSGGDPSTVIEGGFGPQYLPSGYLVYGQDDRLMAVRFDPATLRVSGTATAIEEGVFTKSAEAVSNVAAGADGTVVYVAGRNGGTRARLLWFDRRDGHSAPAVDALLDRPRNLRLSPDGRRVAVTVGPPGQGHTWAYDLDGSARSVKLTFHDHNTFPVWSHDGSRIHYVSIAGAGLSLLSTAADGSSSQPETLLPSGSGGVPFDVSTDGSDLLIYRRAGYALMRLSDHSVRPWFQPPFAAFGGRLSPDGHWFAYAASQTGVAELWVRPFPEFGAPVRVSSGGGHDPAWSRDGQDLFYTNGAKLMAARVAAAQPGLRFDPPRMLFEGGFAYESDDLVLRYYDVAPDGRFLMIEQTKATAASIIVAQHWDQELKARVK